MDAHDPQAPLLGALVPTRVAASEQFLTWSVEVPPLLEGEAVAVAQAAPHRQREFALGRACARRALSEIGWPPIAIPADERRAPIWPPGVRGSITHTRGYVAAAVTDDPRVEGLGIDAERVEPSRLPPQRLLCTTMERNWLAEPGCRPADLVLLFSAKESYFKAWYRRGERVAIDPRDIEVTVDSTRASFLARSLCVQPHLARVGRFHQADDLIVTACVIATDLAHDSIVSCSISGRGDS